MAAPICPRCGYDQSGAVAAWERLEPPACPLAGTCTECGLEFDWADIMVPWRHNVRGLFEHAKGVRQSLSWAFRTWLMTLLPGRFWRRVRLTAPLVVPRLFVWPLVVIALPWAVGSILFDSPLVYDEFVYGWGRHTWAEYAAGWTRPFLSIWAGTFGVWFVPPASPCFLAPVATAILWPLLLLILSDTNRIAKVRHAHILRAFVYSLAWLFLIALVRILDGVIALLISPVRFPLPSVLLMELWPLSIAAILTWQSLWWRAAIRTGFRLPPSVWPVLMIPALLAAASALLYAGAGVRLFEYFMR